MSDALVSHALIEALSELPSGRQFVHCCVSQECSVFDIYAFCSQCGTRIKMRGMAAAPEIEDVFDAVLGWMQAPERRAAAERRLSEIASDEEANEALNQNDER